MIADGYPPELGGLESHVSELAGFLVRRGHRVTVVTRTDPFLEVKSETDGVIVYRTMDIPRPHRADSFIRAVLSIRAALRTFASHYDLVHYHGMFTDAFMGLRSSMPPLILTVHGHFLSCPRYTRTAPDGSMCAGSPSFFRCTACMSKGGSLRALSAPLRAGLATAIQKGRVRGAREFEHIIYVSQSVKQHTHNLVPASRSSVIHNFPPPIRESADLTAAGLEQMGVHSSAFLVLFSARLSPEKGLVNLLRAWSLFRPRHDDAFLIITGSGPQSSIAELASSNPGTRTVFLGRVEKGILNALMQRANVFVVPSVWEEAGPIVALEALSVGTSVIGSNLGGIPEIMQTCSGCLVFDPFDPESIADSLELAYSHRHEKRSAALDQSYMLEYVGRAVEAVYQKAVRRRCGLRRRKEEGLRVTE